MIYYIKVYGRKKMKAEDEKMAIEAIWKRCKVLVELIDEDMLSAPKTVVLKEARLLRRELSKLVQHTENYWWY